MSKMFPILKSYTKQKPHPTSIPWEVADLAYSVYSNKYGRDQSIERMAERGGFGAEEMDELLPDWRERCDVATKLREENEHLQMVVASKQEFLDEETVERKRLQVLLAQICVEISHIGHTRSCSYDASSGDEGDFCNCNLRLRKQLILEARKP